MSDSIHSYCVEPAGESNFLGNFCDNVEVYADSTRLDVLQAAKWTVNKLVGQQKMLNSLCKTARGVAKDLCVGEKLYLCEKLLDVDGVVSKKVKFAEHSTLSLIDAYRESRELVARDPLFQNDVEESVLDAYDQVIVASQTLGVALTDLRWKILEHDADSDELEGYVFTSGKELIDFVRRS